MRCMRSGYSKLSHGWSGGMSGWARNFDHWLEARTWKGYVQRFLRRGPEFRRLLRELESHQKWTEEELLAYQESRLKELLIECKNHVPYYRALFSQLGINPESMPPREALSVVPPLTKTVVKEQPRAFLNEKYRWRLLRKAHTSGTTGTPLTCWRDLYSINFEHAMIWRHWRWANFSFNDRRVRALQVEPQ